VSAGPADAAGVRDAVNRALASLPDRQASVLIDKYVSGYTVEEIARAAQSTPKAVESLLARARVAFRSSFKALMGSRPGGDNSG
jgi:RNA polymerase sigma-70 factor (ECF subfamily)